MESSLASNHILAPIYPETFRCKTTDALSDFRVSVSLLSMGSVNWPACRNWSGGNLLQPWRSEHWQPGGDFSGCVSLRGYARLHRSHLSPHPDANRDRRRRVDWRRGVHRPRGEGGPGRRGGGKGSSYEGCPIVEGRCRESSASYQGSNHSPNLSLTAYALCTPYLYGFLAEHGGYRTVRARVG